MNELKRNPALGEATTYCTQHTHILTRPNTHMHTRTHANVHAHTQTYTHTTYREGGMECPTLSRQVSCQEAQIPLTASRGSRGLLATTQTQLAGTMTLAQTPHKAYTTLAGPRGMLEKVDAPEEVLARSVLVQVHNWASKDEE